MSKTKQSTFHILNKIDVKKYTKKKGAYNYLSWCFAVRELKKACPTARWGVTKAEDGSPFFETQCGYFVEVWVDVDGISLSQIHPVLDNRNNPIEKPNAFEINTSLQRALAKAIALHGLGLYIFAGEDLPDSKLDESLIKRITNLAEKTKDTDVMQKIDEGISSGKINKTNITSYEARILDLIKERENSDSNE